MQGRKTPGKSMGMQAARHEGRKGGRHRLGGAGAGAAWEQSDAQSVKWRARCSDAAATTTSETCNNNNKAWQGSKAAAYSVVHGGRKVYGKWEGGERSTLILAATATQ